MLVAQTCFILHSSRTLLGPQLEFFSEELDEPPDKPPDSEKGKKKKKRMKIRRKAYVSSPSN